MASRERRGSGVLVLMTASERERLHSLAALLGVSCADVVRSLVARECERKGVAR